MKKKIKNTVHAIKNNLNKESIVKALQVEDPHKQHLTNRTRERRAARIETLPNGDKRSNDRRSQDRRESRANLQKFWTPIFVWAILAFLLTLVMVFGKFSDAYMSVVVGFYSLSLIFFIYLTYLFSRYRNRRKSDKNAYFYVVLGGLSIFSFVMCEVGILLY